MFILKQILKNQPMKKFSFLVAFLFVANLAICQTDWDYEWEHYNIAFTLSDKFKVLKNTADEFTAQGNGISVSLFPFEDGSIDHTNITKYVLDIAKSVELEELDDVDIVELNGLKGAYVEGYKAGDRIIVLGFIDETSHTNFFATLNFADDDAKSEAAAIAILQSIRKK